MKLVHEKRDDKDSACKTDRERETKSFASLTQFSSSPLGKGPLLVFPSVGTSVGR
jgi:hypothetical protein